jgi:hypothetical protein
VPVNIVYLSYWSVESAAEPRDIPIGQQTKPSVQV